MKTIIKEGKKEFIGRCKHCGCEFKYELEDISFWSVQCPCCDYFICHENQIENINDVVRDNFGNPVYPYYPQPSPIPRDYINCDATQQLSPESQLQVHYLNGKIYIHNIST